MIGRYAMATWAEPADELPYKAQGVSRVERNGDLVELGHVTYSYETAAIRANHGQEESRACRRT
jgi:hypothetical protein